jgi:hypothetical protein
MSVMATLPDVLAQNQIDPADGGVDRMNLVW